MDLLLIDDFLPEFDAVRQRGIDALYIDWEGYDGQVYKRVCLEDIPEVTSRIEQEIGPVEMLGMGFRLNFEGELPNAAIHSDMGWGTHALVLYLNDGESGTAFWRHKETDADRIDPGDLELYHKIKGDWDDESKWIRGVTVPMAKNRAVIYNSSYFHSRYPFEAFGSTAEDGRLIVVAFFTPLNDR